MSVAELRSCLTGLLDRLPAAELAEARDVIETVYGQLAAAWHGSEHPAPHAALSATSAAVDELGEILAGLDEVKAGVNRYTEGL